MTPGYPHPFDDAEIRALFDQWVIAFANWHAATAYGSKTVHLFEGYRNAKDSARFAFEQRLDALRDKAIARQAEQARIDNVVLPNGFIQGSAEDRATWWRCSRCEFFGPHVGTRVDGAKGCMGSCGGITPNPACTFRKDQNECT